MTTDCDPTWEICEEPEATEEVDTVDLEEVPEEEAASPMGLVWGAVNTWMVVEALLAKSAFSSYATDLSTDNVGTYSAWTEDYVKEADPISSWITGATVQLGFHSVGTLLWALNMGLDNEGGPIHMIFWRWSQLSLLAPLLGMALTFMANSGAEDCADLAAANFDGTSGTDQYVSCKDGADAQYGASGTIVKGVTEDPSGTWFLLNMVSCVAALAVGVLSMSDLAAAYNDAKICTDEAGNEIDCPEEESAAEEETVDEGPVCTTNEWGEEICEGDAPAEDVWWM